MTYNSYYSTGAIPNPKYNYDKDYLSPECTCHWWHGIWHLCLWHEFVDFKSKLDDHIEYTHSYFYP